MIEWDRHTYNIRECCPLGVLSLAGVSVCSIKDSFHCVYTKLSGEFYISMQL